ncbi:hypothetical protein [Micromonospora cremea]|uniref:Uncharacterized protein n=1 Tax=Micromonospora cremea TaxID=709881 RepID=A0A1N5ZRG3_9ACTN|nr:hypothetical protein [Micromonospora cremea]SIN24379.1 hypothetical protein SAMN04489832_4326 [Micromonospora cremea]
MVVTDELRRTAKSRRVRLSDGRLGAYGYASVGPARPGTFRSATVAGQH